MRRSRMLPGTVALLVALAGCAGGADGTTPPRSADPPAPSTATAPAGSSAVPTSTPGRDDTLPFPTGTAERLEHARYDSSPPFDLAFTFETPGEGWESLHLLGEFVDIVRWDGARRNGPPPRWIAFAHPTVIRGTEDVPVEGLSAGEIAAVLHARDDLEVTEPEPFELAGTPGVRVDLRPDHADTIIFGGPAGSFAMEPSRFGRLGIVVVDGEVLGFLVSAPPDELDEAWDEAQVVLESVRFDPA